MPGTHRYIVMDIYIFYSKKSLNIYTRDFECAIIIGDKYNEKVCNYCGNICSCCNICWGLYLS